MKDFQQLYLRMLKFKNLIERSERELLKNHGLSRNDTLVISALDGKELTLSELCDTCCIDKSTMTKIVKKLLSDGYVIKSEESRCFTVSLTRKGEELLKSSYTALELLEKATAEFLNEEELKNINALFDKLLSVSEEKLIDEIKRRIT